MCNLLFYLDFLFSQNTQDFMNYGLDFRSQWVTNNVYISCIKISLAYKHWFENLKLNSHLICIILSVLQ